mgnify:CR=1 FL=1|tara:strand:- start:2946 stop:4748 length:1803 start_codon:yes stop_codon:yes gene_type:complete
MSCSKHHISIEDICKNKHDYDSKNDEICKNIIYTLLDLIKKTDDVKKINTNLLKLTRNKNGMLRKTDIIHVYRKLIHSGELKKNDILWSILQKCKARNISGLSVVTLLLAPFPDGQLFSCKHNCYYCPDETVKNGADYDMPRSYLMREPAVQRGFRNGWDAVKQMLDRLDSLYKCGHEVDKLEIILEGGTYTEYPVEYLERFHRDIFWAANTYFDIDKREPYEIDREIIINQTAKVPIIGICIETRPDAMNDFWIRKFRDWGVTRVQLGVQHTNNIILKKVNRGHSIECVEDAMRLLKDNCFKIDIHLMPDLPNSTPELDKQMFRDVFLGDKYQPDQVKIYPCEVTPYTVIEKWYKSGKYTPYCETNPNDLIDVVKYGMELCPPWVRLPRVVRDIPLDYIQSGNMLPNLRQIIDDKFKQEGKSCKDMRTRETGRHSQYKLKDAVWKQRKYYASGSWEYFISLESKDEVALFGFIRLRLPPKQHSPLFNCLTDKGLIRELHVYGNLVPVGAKSKDDIQHHGVGKNLVKKAEWIAWCNGYKGMAIISGEGVKNYYRKLGYYENNTFMVKDYLSAFTITHYREFIILSTLLCCWSCVIRILSL